MNKILIRFPNWVGDVVMATSFLATVRNEFPAANISVALREHLAPLLWGNPNISEIITVTKSDEHDLKNILKWAHALREKKFDAAFILPISFSSALPVYIAGIPVRIGWKTDGRWLLINKGINRDRPFSRRLLTDQYRDLLEAAAPGKEIKKTAPRLYITNMHRDMASQALRRSDIMLLRRPVIAINPSATFGPSKKWIPLRYGWVIEQLKRRTKGSVILVGGAGDALDLEYICGISGGCSHGCFVGSAASGLAELTGILSRVDLVISNDTGAAHMAAALGRPTLTIFGASDPLWTPPQGAKARLIYHPAECSPCFKPECRQKRHLCMENVLQRDVLETALGMLEK